MLNRSSQTLGECCAGGVVAALGLFIVMEAQGFPTLPGQRYGAALAWDASRGEAVLFGGLLPDCSLADDTWLWDGRDWRQAATPMAPRGRFHSAALFDSARDRTVLVAGERIGGNYLRDVWEWDGEAWQETTSGTGPAARGQHVAFYDPEVGPTVYGGLGTGAGSCLVVEGTAFCRHVWTDARRRGVPHLVASFDLGSLRPAAADAPVRSTQRVSLRVRAGGLGHGPGTGAADGVPVPGFTVGVVAAGHGGLLRLHESDEATPEAMETFQRSYDLGWTCGERWCEHAHPDRWEGADGTLRVDVAARGAWGASPQPATLDVDYLELRVEQR